MFSRLQVLGLVVGVLDLLENLTLCCGCFLFADHHAGHAVLDRNRKHWVFAGNMRHSTHRYLPVHTQSHFQITLGLKRSAPTTVRTVWLCVCMYSFFVCLLYKNMCAIGIERTPHQSPQLLSNVNLHVPTLHVRLDS